MQTMLNLSEDRVARLSSLIDGARSIVIAAHTHPDGDALGSTTALLHYCASRGCPSVSVVLPDTPPASIRFICGEDARILYADQMPEEAAARIAAAELILLADCNAFSRTEGLAPYLSASRAPKVLLDHHLNPDEPAFQLVFSDAGMSSASELIYWILLKMKDIDGNPARLPAAAARALMAGMTTDTNNFANSVTPDTLRMAAGLLEAGVDRNAILGQLYQRYRENRVRVMGYLQSENLRLTPEGGAYMIATEDLLQRFDVAEGETEGLVNIPLSIDQVRISLFLKQDKGHFRVSIRSKRGTSAQRLAASRFHGGGHENAAGGKLFFPGDIASPQDAAAYIEQTLKEFLA